MKRVSTCYLLALFLLGTFFPLVAGCGSENASAPKPVFGKAVLGQDLKNPDAIVHFIVQGPDIYIDQNRDNIAQPDELNTSGELPPITSADGKTTYRLFELRLGVALAAVSESLPQQLGLTVSVDGDFSYEQIGTILLKSNPNNTTWVQFDGPMRLFNNQEGLTFFKDGKEIEVQLFAGTIARGSSELLGTAEQPEPVGNPSVPLSEDEDIRRITYIVPTANSPYPQVRLEFPTEGDPIVRDLNMDKFC